MTLQSSTGGTVRAIQKYAWDTNGDKLTDSLAAHPVVKYVGSYTVSVEVLTSDGPVVDAILPLTVGPAPTITADRDEYDRPVRQLAAFHRLHAADQRRYDQTAARP